MPMSTGMTVARLIGVLQPLVYLLLATVAVNQWRSRHSEPAGWLAVTVLVIAALVAVGRAVQPDDHGQMVDVARRCLAVLLGVFPYSLYRFTTSLSGHRRAQDRLAVAGMLLVSGAALVVPSLHPGTGGWPLWLKAFAAAVAVEWTGLSLLSMHGLWSGGRRLPGVARRRVRLLAAAALLLNGAVLMLIGSGGRHGASASTGQQGLALGAGVLFLVGFAPPGPLRVAWRRREMDAFRDGEADLMSADTEAQVVTIVLTHAIELVGASAAVMVDARGAVRGRRGIDDGHAAAIARRLPVPSGTIVAPAFLGELVALPLGAGWLAVVTTPATPLFGREEIGLLGTLAHLGDLALARINLLDMERVSRKALAERESQLAEAQRTAHIGSYSWDPEAGHAWSDEMCRLLGFAPGEVVDPRSAFASRIHPEDRDRVFEAWARAHNEIAPDDIEYRVILPDGQSRWLHGRVQPLQEGPRDRLVGTVQDITDRKQAEARLRDAFEREQRMVAELRELARVKTDFVSTISHELRTPLTSIVGYLELLADGAAGALTPRQLEVLDVVDRNARRLSVLIEDLLTLSSVDGGGFTLTLAPVDVVALVESVHRTVLPSARTRGLILDLDVDPDVGMLVADASQIDRVLLNLLTNAVKFTPDGGHVALRARRDFDRMVFAVTDTGIGVPVDEQKDLFSRFFRSSAATELAIPGTGLGLAIVKTIVEEHAGTITVESAPGVGTTVTFTLPVATSGAGELARPRPVAFKP